MFRRPVLHPLIVMQWIVRTSSRLKWLTGQRDGRRRYLRGSRRLATTNVM